MPKTSWSVRMSYVKKLGDLRENKGIPETLQTDSQIRGLEERARTSSSFGQPWDTILKTCQYFRWNVFEEIDFSKDEADPSRVGQMKSQCRNMELPPGYRTWKEALEVVNSPQWKSLLLDWKAQAQGNSDLVVETGSRILGDEQFQFGDLDRVGTGPEKAFQGREQELRILDDSLTDPQTKIVVLHAFGGTGKTALVKRWISSLQSRSFRGVDCAFGYSFYDQGQVNGTSDADPFFTAALAQMGDACPSNGTPYERVLRLTRLICERKCLLVIDGIEVLQYAPTQGHGNDILNHQFREFLFRVLGSKFPGLIVVTTRYLPRTLVDRPNVSCHELKRLDLPSGVDVLRAIGVNDFVDDDGSNALENLVNENEGHALALVMIGSYLVEEHDGDPRRRHEIRDLPDLGDHGRHATKVLAHYEGFFACGGTGELLALRAISLFDKPTAYDEFEVLYEHCCKTSRRTKTDGQPLAPRQVVQRLVKLGLLTSSRSRDREYLDVHPIVRAYYRSRFRTSAPRDWSLANEFLFRRLLKAAPKCLSSTADGELITAKTSARQLPVVEHFSETIRHACDAGRLWDALVILACRVDESMAPRFETPITWLLRLWGVISRSKSVEHWWVSTLGTLGKLGIPPLARFYREDAEVHAAIGFYLGSQLQGWDARFMMSLPFYPSRSFAEAPLLNDRFFSSLVDLWTAFCASSLGRGDTAFMLSMRAARRLIELHMNPLACVALTGAAITRMNSGQLDSAKGIAAEALAMAVTRRWQADATGLLAACHSRRGEVEQANEAFDKAFALGGRFSTRIMQCYWEHVVRYFPIAEATRILDSAEAAVPRSDTSASDINYRTHLAVCGLELQFRLAYESNSRDRENLPAKMEQTFVSVPNYHFEGAAFRTEMVLLRARILTWFAENIDSSEASQDTAFAEVMTAERLARSFGFLPYVSDALSLQSQLLRRRGNFDEANAMMEEATSITRATGYRWGIDEAARIERQTS